MSAIVFSGGKEEGGFWSWWFEILLYRRV